MTRMIVAVENKDDPVQSRIEPGALYVEEDQVVPVVWNGNAGDILGRARSVKRDGNNVTMEIELFDGIALDLDDGIGAFVYVQPFEGTPHPMCRDAIGSVTKGRIREVSLHDNGEISR